MAIDYLFFRLRLAVFASFPRVTQREGRLTAWRNNGNGNGNKIYPKNTTNLDFQVVDHSLAEFYRNVFSNSVVEADDILGRLGIFGLQGDHHILVKLLKFTDMQSV